MRISKINIIEHNGMKQLTLFVALLIICISCDSTTKLTPNIPITSNEEVETDIEINTLRFDAQQLVDDTTIYEFLNTAIESDSLNLKLCNAIVAREYYPLFSDRSEATRILRNIKGLSTADIDFMYQQSLYSPKFELKKEKLKTEKGLKIPDACNIQDKAYWCHISKQFGSFCNISLPLFSEDRETALISYSYNCGVLCGHGGYYVFRKENTTWTLVSVLEEWVS